MNNVFNSLPKNYFLALISILLAFVESRETSKSEPSTFLAVNILNKSHAAIPSSLYDIVSLCIMVAFCFIKSSLCMRLSGDFQLCGALVTSCNYNWSIELSNKFRFPSRGFNITWQWVCMEVCINYAFQYRARR